MVEATSFYDIVINADTIISLRNPCSEFAVWDKPRPLEEAVPLDKFVPRSLVEEIDPFRGLNKKQRIKKMKLMKEKHRQSEASFSNPNVLVTGSPTSLEPVDTLPENDQAAPASVGGDLGRGENGLSLFGAGSSAVPGPPAPAGSESGDGIPNTVSGIAQDLEVGPTATVQLVNEPVVEFRVCAGNLMSASPWFNRVLTKDGWMESSSGPEDRWFRISAEDWDEEAFVILMNIFHLRNHSVPRTVSLEMLAKIAILADYYECNESIEMFTDIWLPHLRKTTPVPKTYCRDLILWVWISWALKLSDLFEEATTVAIQQAVKPVKNLGLPIPAWISHEIDHRRSRAIESVITGIYARLDAYRSAKYECPSSTTFSFQCGSMLFGALTKEMDSAQLMSSRPTEPFSELSFEALCSKVRSMKSSGWYHTYYEQHTCNISTHANSIVDSAVTGVLGLSLRRQISPWKAAT